jgi:hypothetical protein
LTKGENMSDNDIYTENNTGPDPDKDYFTELVGEDKRFKSPQELARGKVEADTFIERLQQEAAELRAELDKRVTYEELIDKVGARNSGGVGGGNSEPRVPETPPAGVGQEDIQRLVEEQLAKRTDQERRAQNAAEVKRRLQEEYGRDYVSRLKQRTDELNTTQEFMTELSQTNPQMFFELLGQPRRDGPSAAPPRSSVNTGAFAPRTNSKNYAYYSEIRAKDPRKYFTPQVQREMFAEAKRQGTAFYE